MNINDKVTTPTTTLITTLALIPVMLGSLFLTALVSPLFLIIGIAALIYFLKVYPQLLAVPTDTRSITVINAADVTTKR